MAYKRQAFLNIKTTYKQRIGQQQQPKHNLIQIKERQLTKTRPQILALQRIVIHLTVAKILHPDLKQILPPPAALNLPNPPLAPLKRLNLREHLDVDQLHLLQLESKGR